MKFKAWFQFSFLIATEHYLSSLLENSHCEMLNIYL